MTDRDALLRAIREHPDDDTPRLVYADWLDENGEPERAAFIRFQIANPDAVTTCMGDSSVGQPCPVPSENLDNAERVFCPTCQSLIEEGVPAEFLGEDCYQIRRGFIDTLRGPLAAFWAERACENCDGEGTIESPDYENTREPCPDCGGQWEPRDDEFDPGYSPGAGRAGAAGAGAGGRGDGPGAGRHRR